MITVPSAFIATSLALIVSPGPDVVFVFSCSIAGGRRSGVLSAIGIVAGLMVHITAASFGISAALSKSTMVFQALKLVGGTYLLWLAWQAWRHRAEPLEIKRARASSPAKYFWSGFLASAMNPKLGLFFLALFPQFLATGSSWKEALCLGAAFAFMAFIWFMFVATTSSNMTLFLKRSQRALAIINTCSATALAVLGIVALASGFAG